MVSPSKPAPEAPDSLFDLGASVLLAGFTALLVVGLVWSSGLFNDLAAPFLLGAFVVLYFGNRTLHLRERNSSHPLGPEAGPPAD